MAWVADAAGEANGGASDAATDAVPFGVPPLGVGEDDAAVAVAVAAGDSFLLVGGVVDACLADDVVRKQQREMSSCCY